MQKRAPWLAIPLATVDDLIHVFESSDGPWPRSAAALDLALHLDAAASPFSPVPFPSQRTLAARWRWPHGKVRGLLASVEEWADPAKHSANTAVAQHSHSANTARKVEAVESSKGQHSANTALTHDSHSANTATIPADIEKAAFEYGLSEVGTDSVSPSTVHTPPLTETKHAARDASAMHPEPPMPPDDLLTGSKPTDTDPIGNGGDKTSHPVSAGHLSPEAIRPTAFDGALGGLCLLYTSPSPRDA